MLIQMRVFIVLVDDVTERYGNLAVYVDIESASQEAWRCGIRDHIQDAENQIKDLSDASHDNFHYIEEWEVGVPLDDKYNGGRIATYYLDNWCMNALYSQHKDDWIPFLQDLAAKPPPSDMLTCSVLPTD